MRPELIARGVTFYEADCRDVLVAMIERGEMVESAVFDPPYFLDSVVKRFGKKGYAAVKYGTDGRFTRQSKGFMGQKWDAADDDGTRITQDSEFWKLVYQVLLPGAYVLAFSSPRTGHWQACAMETAGFIMHPFKTWVFGSGMPKAHSVSRGIDKALGVNRKVLGHPDVGPDMRGDSYGRGNGDRMIQEITEATSEEAKKWDGWYYGTQAEKPAVEPIYMAQKPFSEKTGYANVMKHGVGAINIDGCRVEPITVNGGNLADNPHLRQSINGGNGGNIFPREENRRVVIPSEKGRWPAGLAHDGSDVVLACFPQSNSGGKKSTRDNEESAERRYDDVGSTNFAMKPGQRRTDDGSAARYFNCFPQDADPVIYSKKASKEDRAGTGHPTVKPVALISHLCRLVTPKGGTVLDLFGGSGTTAQACINEGFNCILVEKEAPYAQAIRNRFRNIQSTIAADFYQLFINTD
jgi:site-specific DNA-methyltransferase (adenine-specific)